RLSTAQRAYHRALMRRQTNDIVGPSRIVGAGHSLDNADQRLLSTHLLPSKAQEAYRTAQCVFSFRGHDAQQPSLLISAGSVGIFAARVAYEVVTRHEMALDSLRHLVEKPRRIFSGCHPVIEREAEARNSGRRLRVADDAALRAVDQRNKGL